MFSRVLKAKNYKNGITFLDTIELKKALNQLPDYIEVVLRDEKHPRSNQQNKYYWGVVVETLAKELGYSREEMHEILKAQFLKSYTTIHRGVTEKEVEIIRSTTDLTTKEMEEYCEHIRVWAVHEFSIRILAPHEVDV